MKKFTLTLLTFLLLQWSTLHKISCTSTVAVNHHHHNTNNHDEVHHSPLSNDDNLLKADVLNAAAVSSNLTDHKSSIISSALVNEKKSQRDQRTLYRRAGGHLRSDVSTSSSTTTTTTTEKSTTSSSSQKQSPSNLNQSDSSSSTVASSREVIYPVNSNNVKNHKSYFRRKTKAPSTRNNTSKSHRDVNEKQSGNNKVINVTILDSLNSKEINDTSDDENSLDYGLMTLSAAGEGNRNDDLRKTIERDADKKDESKKTLSDQIAEGKYGLIEKEIFTKAPKAPGIISYKTNPETPDDNEKTLGGLSKDEIWLAEDHLLVLKGGIANDKKNNDDDWSPIDNYEAPKRPVKIPINPRVPPPFPIQLEDNGPLQFIGHNQFSLFNPYTNETGLFANVDGHIKTHVNKANGDNEKDFTAGLGKVKNLTKDQIHEVVPPPPWLFHNSYKDADLLKHFPFNLPLPDQVLNRTDDFDEDDPSLFYPPPYSFVYKTNYTNLAPVGPLVPGIILPPPPDFFSVYNPEADKNPIKTPLDAYKRIKEIQLKNRLSATPSSSTTTTTPKPPSTITSSGYIRDFTRKTKPTTTTIQTTKLYKTKTTTLRPTTTQSSSTSPPPREFMNYKTHHYDTTTLRLHPVYIPPSVTATKLYSSTMSTTTPLPTLPPPSHQPPPQQQQHIKQYQKDYGTQAHPIYFEYFDARTANPLPINHHHQFIGPEYDTSYSGSPSSSSTTSTSTLPPQPLYSTPTKVHKKPKSFYPPQYISTSISPANIDAKYLFVTPKPDIFSSILAPQNYPSATDPPISYNTAIPIQKPLILKPVNKFEDEIASIKHTLDYYGGSSNKQQQHKHSSQKPSKVKAVYEFSFEASKHKNQHQQHDQDDFKPMLSYDQKNAHLTELIKTNSYFPTSTEPTMKYYRTKQSATLPPKKNNNNMMETPPSAPYGQKLRQQNLNYYVRPIFKEVVSSPQQSQKLIIYPSHDTQSLPINVDHGYRINSKNTKYRNQQQQQQQQFYGQASEVASLLNDTLVNYKQPQRPINPYSEFIDLSRFPQNNPPQQQHHHINRPPQNSPPYHIYPQQPQFPPPPPQLYPNPFQRPIPQQHHHHQQQQQQQQQQYHHDVVKFEYPLIPQINPDSVHITFYNRPLEKSNDNF